MKNEPVPKHNSVELVNIAIKIATPEDWEEYKKIRLESLQQAPNAFNDTYEKALERPDEEWKKRLKRDSSVIFIAKNNSEPIGITGAFKEGVAESWKLVSVYVSPNFRGRGVFKKIFQEVMIEIKKRNGTKIVLEVNPEQKDAVYVYQALGFKMLRELKDVRLRNNRITSSYEMEFIF